MLDGFHDRESSHTACRNKVHLTALESEVFTGRVTVDKQHPKRSVNWEMVHQFR